MREGVWNAKTRLESVASSENTDLERQNRQLVEVADEAIATGRIARAPTSVLPYVLAEAAPEAIGDDIATTLSRASPAMLFDAFTTARFPALRRELEPVLEVVAPPLSPIVRPFEAGDVLVRRGEGNLAHMAILVTGELRSPDELRSAQLPMERHEHGLYAQVVESGYVPHTIDDEFFRRVAGERWHTPRHTLVLRFRPEVFTQGAEVVHGRRARVTRRRVDEHREIPWEQPAAAATLRVSVRTDFLIRAGQGVSFHWVPGEAVARASVAIVGANIQGVTSNQGVAVLNTAQLPDGDHVVRVSHATAAQTSAGPAGPTTAEPLANPPARIYRTLDIQIRTRAGALQVATLAARTTHGQLGNRSQNNWSATELPVDWKPVWMRSPRKQTPPPPQPATVQETMRQSADITLIVVHHTGGPQIGPAINTFLNPGEPRNAHYLVDLNGHVVKLAEDLRAAWQAGRSRWGGIRSVNSFSIGIEIVHRDGAFRDAQYEALIELVRRLRAGHPTIAAHRIVGHSDIATTSRAQPDLLGDRRANDPGVEFDWDRLERQGLGMVPTATSLGNYYGGIFFAGQPSIELQRGDRDPRPNAPARIGGQNRPGFQATPIRELQEDLEHLGYSARPQGGPVGDFHDHTRKAVEMFQRHFWAGSRKGYRTGRTLGRVDAMTANWVKSVRAGVP